jgi:hypothetical protein
MRKQIKYIVHIALLAITGLVLVSTLPSCKANKCDCPTFGGHRLSHN